MQAGKMKRTVKILLLLALSSAFLSGCNTARGMGEDIQDLGHIISHAAS
jgi:Predicted small secreted protein